MKEIYKIVEGYNNEKLELTARMAKDTDYYRSGSHDNQIIDIQERIKEIDDILESIVSRLLKPVDVVNIKNDDNKR